MHISNRPTADVFQAHRPLLFSIAYRMLGSASEAEDIVQEAYLRFSRAQPDEVRSPKSYLSTIVTRLCLDHLKSARVERERYVGPWLPEPVLTEAWASPLQMVEQRESVSMAFLVMLEALAPEERAVFLLREAFEYGYDEIAAMLGKSEAACRQLFHRAKERLHPEGARRARFEASPETQRQVTERFFAACQSGDVSALMQVLAPGVTVWSDGGGKVPAATRPVHGADAVSRFILGLFSKAPPNMRVTFHELNGGPGLLIWDGESLVSVGTFEIADGRIQALRFVLNPSKQAYLLRQLQERP